MPWRVTRGHSILWLPGEPDWSLSWRDAPGHRLTDTEEIHLLTKRCSKSGSIRGEDRVYEPKHWTERLWLHGHGDSQSECPVTRGGGTVLTSCQEEAAGRLHIMVPGEPFLAGHSSAPSPKEQCRGEGQLPHHRHSWRRLPGVIAVIPSLLGWAVSPSPVHR